MDGSALAFLLKYSSPFSILVISEEDKLQELHCPFQVKAIRVVKNLMVGEIRTVTQVKLATNNKLVFIINDTPFYYYYFNILLK